MTVKEVAKLAGVSVRTLHHYDEIGLLQPRRNAENSYREYGPTELDLLQQILLFRECGFPLAAIEKILKSPGFQRVEALDLQKNYLLYEKRRIDMMLHTLEKTMRALKGEIQMSEKEKFAGFDFKHNPYEEEARNRWGDKAVDSSNEKIAGMSDTEKSDAEKGMNELFKELAALRGKSPDSLEVQAGVGKLYHFFTQTLGISYTPEAFAGVGMLYVQDKRFTENIDNFGEGLAALLSEAMQIYAEGLPR